MFLTGEKSRFSRCGPATPSGCRAGAGSRPPAGAPAAGPAQPLTVVAKDFNFTPADFTVKANLPVRITYRNEDTTIHDWVVLNIPVNGNAGKVGTLDFTPTRPGTCRIVCSIAGRPKAVVEMSRCP